MPSQADLDQGGTYRQWVKRFLGPSVGWVWTPSTNQISIGVGGTTTITLGTTLVSVQFNGAVTIQLPSTQPNSATAGAAPGQNLRLPITIVDVGGFVSDAQPIKILPFGAETIMGMTEVDITSPFGAISLAPTQLAVGGPGGWGWTTAGQGD
jgi:hypothetical protein